MHFALEKIRGFCFTEKIRQKFAYAGKSGIIYTRDEERKIKFKTKFLQLKNTKVLNKEREENMKNFLRNMAALIVVVAMNMAALIIAVAMVALIIVVAMVALFITVVWMNKMGLN